MGTKRSVCKTRREKDKKKEESQRTVFYSGERREGRVSIPASSREEAERGEMKESSQFSRQCSSSFFYFPFPPPPLRPSPFLGESGEDFSPVPWTTPLISQRAKKEGKNPTAEKQGFRRHRPLFCSGQHVIHQIDPK